MTEIWNILSAAFRETPPWLSALLLAWAVSWGCTQALKFFLPIRWDVHTRREMAQLLAFLTAFLTVATLKPLPLAGTLALAFATAFWSPISFALLMAFLRKRWPYLADVLTQDVRGVLIGDRTAGGSKDDGKGEGKDGGK